LGRVSPVELCTGRRKDERELTGQADVVGLLSTGVEDGGEVIRIAVEKEA
jgi:hypothetical protein